MRKLLFSLVILTLGNSLIWSTGKNTDPIKDYWKILELVDFKSHFDSEIGEIVFEPIFNKKIQSLDGKTIQLSGYLMPAEDTKGIRILYKDFHSYNDCYFDPKTWVELDANKITIETKDMITVKGVLKLNTEDPLKTHYRLDDAEIIQETPKK